MHGIVIQRWLIRLRQLPTELGWPRYVPKRYAFVGCFVFFVIIYYFLYEPLINPSKRSTAAIEQCVNDFFTNEGTSTNSNSMTREKTSFVGNGLIGMDALKSKELIVLPSSNQSGQYLFTGFYPLVDVNAQFSKHLDFYFISDQREGLAKAVACAVMSEKCVCIYQSVYAHRTRPNILVQVIRILNPTSTSLSITFNRKSPNRMWEQKHGSHGSGPIFTSSFTEAFNKIHLAIVCTETQTATVTIKPKIEETFRFICFVEIERANAGTSENIVRDRLSSNASLTFSQISQLNSNELDNQHKNAWKSLNTAYFNLSNSKAPNALNIDQIDAVKYALLSTTQSPLLSSESAKKKEAELGFLRTELCYSGHSTLLTPSKLWQSWSDVHDLLSVMDVWKLTLEHHGCSRLIQGAGSHGILQAFLLSLSAATFTTQTRLEVALDPDTELHRSIQVNNLQFGPGAVVSIHFDLDLSLKPFVSLHSNSITPLYACTAGCLEPPHLLSGNPTVLAIKITKPVTPILFISREKAYLERIKHTLHVIEIVDAPAHESQKIDLHKHGESGGLPTLFWVILVFILIAFHLFLFKLLYSEWQNSSAVPYSKFNKKVLFQR